MGPFSIEDSVTLEQIEKIRDTGELDSIIKKTDFVFSHLPMLILDETAERFVRNGNPLFKDILKNNCKGLENLVYEDGFLVRIYSKDGEFLAVYGWKKAKDCLCAVKMFL